MPDAAPCDQDCRNLLLRRRDDLGVNADARIDLHFLQVPVGSSCSHQQQVSTTQPKN